ncbi:hypothetical protein GWI33_011212 [Rhynchophorus ferrugineus]|uniref:Uncharacterized protein n=1 Tax=Rhynchophorus ferrugineus TaxID=354439 RepID=A0A834ID27_RHYFE|nr:hypothetical protein GWI33_011212 [Rhynchophorus ferrugineus]
MSVVVRTPSALDPTGLQEVSWNRNIVNRRPVEDFQEIPPPSVGSKSATAAVALLFPPSRRTPPSGHRAAIESQDVRHGGPRGEMEREREDRENGGGKKMH